MKQGTGTTDNGGLYNLSTGEPLASGFSSPGEEYRDAFQEREQPFLYYYTFENGAITTQLLTRGDFWDLACRAATCLIREGITKGSRIAHCFSRNSPLDLIFRLADVLVGAVPVTINWQADNTERIVYKATVTQAKVLLYDEVFAEKIGGIKISLKGRKFLCTSIPEICLSNMKENFPSLNYEDEKGIIFTSGTTGLPKGVILSHRSYLANRLTFEDYFRLPPSLPIDLLLVNPLHHTNSSALADWGMRRSKAVIHLAERYSTLFWQLLTEITEKKEAFFIASLVPRHLDFLENLQETSELPVEKARLEMALARTELLLGSAPVGPCSLKSARKFSGRLPHVRFGSTETCLQVMAIPVTMTQEKALAAFEAGLQNVSRGESASGHYIGRPHPPFTAVRIVKAVDPEKEGYLLPCKPGEPGYFITRGPNVMTAYAAEDEATQAVFREGWYTGLRDIGFALPAEDGKLDYYWMARDSAMLIRGGANYAYEQVAADLSQVLREDFHLTPEQCKIAVVGLKIDSEHEDSCCVTLELEAEAASMKGVLEKEFIDVASRKVPKGCRPDHLRFGQIPRNFKGAVLYPQLKEEFKMHLRDSQPFLSSFT